MTGTRQWVSNIGDISEVNYTLDTSMRTLCVQFQPQRSPGLAAGSVTTLMARIAVSAAELSEFTVRRGSARGPYVNYLFTGRKPQRIWRALRSRALTHR